MNNAVILIFVVFAHATELIFGAPLAFQKRGIREYGPPIHISSSVIGLQVEEGSFSNDEVGASKPLSNGEWVEIQAGDDNYHDFDAGSSGLLKFAGVVGSGHVYVPDGSSTHFGNINDGVHGNFFNAKH